MMMWLFLLACTDSPSSAGTETDPGPPGDPTGWSFGGQIGEGGDTNGCSLLFGGSNQNTRTPDAFRDEVTQWSGGFTTSQGARGSVMVTMDEAPRWFSQQGDSVIDCTALAPGYQANILVEVQLESATDHPALDLIIVGTAMAYDGYPPSFWAGKQDVDWPARPEPDLWVPVWAIATSGPWEGGTLGWWTGEPDSGLVTMGPNQTEFTLDP